MKSQRKIYFYEDLLTDDFGPKPKRVKKISGSYHYRPRFFLLRFMGYLSYRFILTPVALIYTKSIRRIKIHNKKSLAQVKGKPAFIYANHTHPIADAFAPNAILWPKNVSMVTNATNVSLPMLGGITKCWGALPLPDDFAASKNFIKEVTRRINKKVAIVIYPEAKLWPYYTKIRPFDEKSFVYPIKYNVPIFSFTTVYSKGKRGKLKTAIYIDGPFYPKEELSKQTAQLRLRDEIYQAMSARSKLSNFEKIIYQTRSN